MYKTTRIRKLNDLFRTTFNPQLGEVFITSGVANLDDARQTQVMRRLVGNTYIDDDSGEKSQGFFREGGVDYLWQIQVLDRDDHEYESEAPWNKTKSWRRLTLMRADEY